MLDWDGVLAETKLNFSPIREKFFQGRFVPLFEAIATLPQSLAEELSKDIYDVEMSGAAEAKPVPGALELVNWLENNKVPWCVVSRNCTDSILLAAQRAQLPLPPFLFSRDTPPVKPAPEALWRAAETLDVPAAECVMIGDFLYDLVCARRAGMRALLVQRPQAEWKHWADASFDKLTEFVEYLRAPTPLVPWEYHHIASQEDGENKLDEISKYVFSISSSRTDLLSLCLQHASMGVLNFFIEGENMLTSEQWFDLAGLSPVWLDQPVKEVLGHLLHTRYPLARLIDDTDGFLLLPRTVRAQ